MEVDKMLASLENEQHKNNNNKTKNKHNNKRWRTASTQTDKATNQWTWTSMNLNLYLSLSVGVVCVFCCCCCFFIYLVWLEVKLISLVLPFVSFSEFKQRYCELQNVAIVIRWTQIHCMCNGQGFKTWLWMLFKRILNDFMTCINFNREKAARKTGNAKAMQSKC